MDKIDPRDEKLKKELDKLFADWRRDVINKKPFKSLKTKFSKDGALSGYFCQNFKILSIGWESHSDTPDLVGLVGYFLSGGSAKERDKKFRGKKAKKNNLNCWQLAARIVYGLLHGVENWNDIPKKKDLEGPFRKGEFSFAVMNISKYENPQGPDPSDDFLKYVATGLWKNRRGRNFTREEIDLLDPDLIITWNLSRLTGKGFLEQLTDPLRTGPYPRNREPVSTWMYKSSKGREIPLIDAYHFSGRKNHEKCYYNPIKKAVKKFIAQGKLKVKKI